MNLPTKNTLTDDEVKAGLRLVTRDGMAAQAITTFTGGAFLVAFALQLGATNFQIGLIAAIPTLANVFQLASVYLVHKYANRRKIVVTCSLLSRLAIVPMVLTPCLQSNGYAVYLLIVALCAHHFVGAISAGAWSSWMRDLIPGETLGAFFSHRLRLSQILGASLSAACALYLDYVAAHWAEFEMWGHATLFFMGTVAGLISVRLLVRTPEPTMAPITASVLQLVTRPFKNPNFRNLILYMGTWNFAVNLAAPFFTVYLLQVFKLSMTYVTGFTLLNYVTNILFVRIWGRYADQFSYRSVLSICVPLYSLCILGWTFTTMPDPHEFTFPLLILIHVFTGMAAAGNTLASTSIGLKFAPKGDAVAYLSATSIVNSFSAGLAPLIGGVFADFFMQCEFAWTWQWKSPQGKMVWQTLHLAQWDFFFMFAFLLGLVALWRLRYVEEAGTVKEKVILRELTVELRRELRGLSTFTGLRAVIHLPFSLFQELTERKKTA